MRIAITIASNDNDAFTEDAWGELVAALHRASARIVGTNGQEASGPVLDVNGNCCGSWEVTE